MFRLRGLCRRLFLVATNRSGEHRRCGRRVSTTRQGNGRGVLRVWRDLYETPARGNVLLQVRANEIRTGRQIAERESAVRPRNGKDRGRADGRDHGTGDRLSLFVLHDATKFAVTEGRSDSLAGRELRPRGELRLGRRGDRGAQQYTHV